MVGWIWWLRFGVGLIVFGFPDFRFVGFRDVCWRSGLVCGGGVGAY